MGRSRSRSPQYRRRSPNERDRRRDRDNRRRDSPPRRQRGQRDEYDSRRDGEYSRRRDDVRDSGRRRDYDDDRKPGRSSEPRRRSPEPSRNGGGGDSKALIRRRSRSRSRSQSRPQDGELEKAPNLEPNFKPSGLLAAATKTVAHADGTTTVLKYHEPPEARKPIQGWRLYVFKGDEQIDLLHIHRQSAYLIGRDHAVVDVPLDHPSCSKQHAAVQYRSVSVQNEYGDKTTSIKPFIIDLESVNGTFVNGEQIPASRYYELKASDMIKFGLSPKEYVLLHDDAA